VVISMRYEVIFGSVARLVWALSEGDWLGEVVVVVSH